MRAILLSAFLLSAAAAADSYSAGDSLEPFTLNDQHGKPCSVTEDTTVIVFSAEKNVSSRINRFLATQSPDYLDSNHALYVADISPMPAFITQTFALPKMRKFSYRLLLDYEGKTTAPLPRQPHQITVIKMEKLKITSIQYVEKSELLGLAMEGIEK